MSFLFLSPPLLLSQCRHITPRPRLLQDIQRLVYGGKSTFSWSAYMESLKRTLPAAVVAPELWDTKPPLSVLFKPGHRLEAVDPRDPALVCVCTVAEVTGKRTDRKAESCSTQSWS